MNSLNTEQCFEPPSMTAPLALEPVGKRDVLPRERLISNIEKRTAIVERIMQGLSKRLN